MTDDALGTKLDKLRLSIESLNARADERHTGVVDQLHSLHAGVAGVRTAQTQQGLAIARLETTCASRGAACGGLFTDLRHRQQKHSDELDKHSGELGDLRGGVQEVSKVTAIADIERKQTWHTMRAVWAVSWKVLLALASLGLLGAGTARVITAITGALK